MIYETIKSGETKTIKFENKKITVKGNGELKKFIIDRAIKGAEYKTDDFITSINDPRLSKLLRNKEVRKKLKIFNSTDKRFINLEDGHSWMVSSSITKRTARKGLFNGALEGFFGNSLGGIFANKPEVIYEQTELYNPKMLINGFPKNSIVLSETYIDGKYRPNSNIVNIKAITEDGDFQTISAIFDAEGAIKKDTIEECIWLKN